MFSKQYSADSTFKPNSGLSRRFPEVDASCDVGKTKRAEERSFSSGYPNDAIALAPWQPPCRAVPVA